MMTDKTLPTISPEIIDPGAMYTLDELCQSCNVEVDWVVQLVEQGVIEPVGQARSDWQFASISIVRVAKARRLGRDLDLSPSGLALVLDLLDELDELRSRLRSLETMPDRLEE
jgi:chaperone modulatory protein CbpM